MSRRNLGFSIIDTNEADPDPAVPNKSLRAPCGRFCTVADEIDAALAASSALAQDGQQTTDEE